MITIAPHPLIEFAIQIFQAAGASKQSATRVATSLVSANLVGHDSHGIIRVVQYLGTIDAGNLDPTAEPVITKDVGAITVVDAQRAFGQVAAEYAMQISVDKAKTHGLAATTLTESNHVGRLGEWVEMAADETMIGLAYCNGSRPGGRVVPFGGIEPRLGTNPLAAAVPVGGQPPIIIDFATSVVAEGKVRVARNVGKPIPEGYILSPDGQPSTRPQDLYEGGSLLPAAGYKGYGLALLADLLGGVLSGIGAPALPDYSRFSNGVLFIVLSIEIFRSTDEFLAESATLCNQLKATTPAPDVDAVLIPGEPERLSAAKRRVAGIPLDEMTWGQLVEAGMRFGIPAPNVS
ncbi:MAG: Ldh family oxidoreductase [Chloroflexota bacterium]